MKHVGKEILLPINLCSENSNDLLLGDCRPVLLQGVNHTVNDVDEVLLSNWLWLCPKGQGRVL